MDIVLIVLDAVRADHLSCYGYSRSTAPNLDRLTLDSVVFEDFYSTAIWTRPSASTILTGLYPGVHGVHTMDDKLPRTIGTLPEYLKAGGFATAAFSPGGNFASALGFGRGFDTFEDFDDLGNRLNKSERFDRKVISQLSRRTLGREKVVLPSSEDMVRESIEWLDSKGGANTFSLLWIIDTHTPYNPPPHYRIFGSDPETEELVKNTLLAPIRTQKDVQTAIDQYDAEILHADDSIGRLMGALKERKKYDDALLIVTSDHGEGFLEHGVAGHEGAPFRELLHAPLVVKFPGSRYAGVRDRNLAWHGDLMPTILEIAGIPHSAVQGRSLLEDLGNDDNRGRKYVYSESKKTEGVFVHHWYSIQSKQWKYMESSKVSPATRQMVQRRIRRLLTFNPGTAVRMIRGFFKSSRVATSSWKAALFDLQDDSLERHDLLAVRPEVAAVLRAELESWKASNEAKRKEQLISPETMTPEEQKLLEDTLRGLGYLE